MTATHTHRNELKDDSWRAGSWAKPVVRGNIGKAEEDRWLAKMNGNVERKPTEINEAELALLNLLADGRERTLEEILDRVAAVTKEERAMVARDLRRLANIGLLNSDTIRGSKDQLTAFKMSRVSTSDRLAMAKAEARV